MTPFTDGPELDLGGGVVAIADRQVVAARSTWRARLLADERTHSRKGRSEVVTRAQDNSFGGKDLTAKARCLDSKAHPLSSS